MAETNPAKDTPEDLARLIPDGSFLSVEQYLEMQRAIGNETRFRILNHLEDTGPQSAKELQNSLDIESNTLHYHLDQLVSVGLVENRKRTDPDSDGLYSYYRATSLGSGILTHGVRELMREEWDLLEAYSGA